MMMMMIVSLSATTDITTNTATIASSATNATFAIVTTSYNNYMHYYYLCSPSTSYSFTFYYDCTTTKHIYGHATYRLHMSCSHIHTACLWLMLC